MKEACAPTKCSSAFGTPVSGNTQATHGEAGGRGARHGREKGYNRTEGFLATTRRTSRNTPARRSNPLREMLNERQKAAEIARSRARVQQLKTELPSLIQDRVGEHMEKLESKLLNDFKALGQRAIEESTAVLNQQLNERIGSLEKVSAMQGQTLGSLRDSSKAADQKVGAVVNQVEKNLAEAVPGFRLEPPAHQALPSASPLRHRQFQIAEAGTEVIKANPPQLSESVGKFGFCPSCTSTNIRRANRSGLFEEFLRLFFIAPFRCRACRHKFYRF